MYAIRSYYGEDNLLRENPEEIPIFQTVKSKKIVVIVITSYSIHYTKLYEGEEYDKLFGFELGVDDYMVKPFSPKELLARLKAILGRSNKVVEEPEKLNRLQIEEVLIDFDARSVYLGKELLSMTPKEYDLFSFFVNNQGKVFSREQLLNQVWGYEFLGDVIV